MTKLSKYLINGAITLFIVFMIFFGGCQYGKTRVKCPSIIHDTTIIYDTITHIINHDVNHYVIHTDTIIKEVQIPVLSKVDSLKVWQDYFAKHFYTREWHDSLLSVTQKDMITQEQIYAQDFKYKWKGATTIIENKIDNSIHYQKYITLGVSVPFKSTDYFTLDAKYQWNKGYIGTFYSNQLKSFGISGGITLFRLK